MKPVEIMLNFFRKKTVKRSEWRDDEPPIMMTSSEENDVRRRKSQSVVFDGDFAANGRRFHSMHSSCSSSLDEVRFAPTQQTTTTPREMYVKNQRKMSFTSAGLDESYSEFQQNGIVRPSNDQRTKLLYHSPKASQRLSNSHRSSGHSRSLSAIADPAPGSRPVGERKGVLDHLRSSVEVVTPRLYRKNPQQQQKPMPPSFHAPSTDATAAAAAAAAAAAGLVGDCPGGAAAEVSFSGSHGSSSQWSFGVDDASPVPPPRKKRSSRAGRGGGGGGGGDVDGDGSSQTSSSTEAASDTRTSRKASVCIDSEFIADASSTAIDSPEFQCNLPNDFSNLGLDILNISSVVLSPSNEKSNFDLLQEIDKKRGDVLSNPASPVTPNESSAIIKSGDILRIEPSTCRILDSDIFLYNGECSSSSVCDSSFESVFQNETELSRRPKLQSQVIVKSIFSKTQKQEFSDRRNLEYEEDEDDDASSGKGDQSFDFSPQHNSSFAASQSHFSSRAPPEVLHNFKRASENCSVQENSADDGLSVPLNSDWNSESVYRGDLLTNSVCALQPDVLIGTQLSPSTTCYVSLFADDSSLKSLDPVNNRVHSTMKPFACDLSVGHQLHGFPSQTLVAINEKSTSRDVIERILALEKLSEDWFLYCLSLISPHHRHHHHHHHHHHHQPRNGSDGAVVELDADDFPVRYLDEDDLHKESVWFELRRTEGIKIRVSCDASFERPKTVSFEISRRLISRFVVEAAAEKLELRSPAKFCLIELDRSRRELAMRRINESEVVAELSSGHFLLCEKEFLFESRRRKVDQLPLISPLSSSSSRLSYSPTRNAFTPESSSSVELFSVCRRLSKGSRLCAVEIDRSQLTLDGVELVPCHEEGGGHCLRVRRTGTCHHLSEGDRILEINGQRVHNLSAVELLAVLRRTTTEKLRVVVLRDETRNNNIHKP